MQAGEEDENEDRPEEELRHFPGAQAHEGATPADEPGARADQREEPRLDVVSVGVQVRDKSTADMPQRVASRLHDRLMLRVPCEVVPAGSLPRFELKARRVIRRDA